MQPPQRCQYAPGENNQFGHSRKHLEGGDKRGEHDLSPAATPRLFDQRHHPGHPSQRDGVIRPDQTRERRSVDDVGEPGKAGSEASASPTMRQQIHAQPAEQQMAKTKITQRPRKRENQVNERERVEHHCAPLREKRRATIAVRIPKRQFAAPETLVMIIHEAVSDRAVVSIKKRMLPDGDFPERDHQEKRENDAEAQRREPFLGGTAMILGVGVSTRDSQIEFFQDYCGALWLSLIQQLACDCQKFLLFISGIASRRRKRNTSSKLCQLTTIFL